MWSTRRPRYSRASKVASSAQWTSSNTAIIGLQPQFVEKGSEVARPLGVRGRRLGSEAVEALCDVVDRPQRPRREQRFASPPHDAGLVLVQAGECAHERGLADARLPADEDYAP